MKALLFSTAAVAALCLTPLAPIALAASEKPAETKIQTPETDAWSSFKQGAKKTWDDAVQAFDDMTRATQTDIVLPKALPGAMSAKSLIGVAIENSKEGRVGSISDFVIGKDTKVDAIVVSDGGFLGINNAQIAVKPSLISIKRNEKGVLRAYTNVTENQLDAASSAAFQTRIQALNDDFKKPDVKTAKRLLGAKVDGPDGKQVATVNDLLLTPIGEVRYALLSTGGLMGVGAKLVAVPASDLTFVAEGKPVTTKFTADQLAKLAAVRAQAAAM